MTFDSYTFNQPGVQLIDGDRGKNYPAKGDFFPKGYCLFLNTKNVTKEGFDFSQTIFINQAKDVLLRKGKLEVDDIILTTRGTIGNVAHYSQAILFKNVRINSGMLILRPNRKFFHPRFLFWALKTTIVRRQFEQISTGCAQPQLPIRNLKNIFFPLPPLPVQKKIASILDAADELRQKDKALIDKYNELTQSLFLEMFGDPVKNPKGWETIAINEGIKVHSYREKYGDQPLGTFIRSIVGLDISVANEVFSDFIQAGNLRADQITFINNIITHLTKNGTIDKGMLFETPFTNIHDQGLIGVFDDAKATKVISILDKVNGNAMVA